MSSFLTREFEKKQIEKIKSERDGSKFDDFKVGDSVSVGVLIRDLSGFRVQAFDGVCIAFSRKGLRTRFTVRRVGAANESIVQSFMLYLSNVDSVKVVRKGRVRRAKLYYLIDRFGKSSKIKEKRFTR